MSQSDEVKDEIEFLKGIWIFRELSREQLEKVASILRPLSYAAGDIILREGEVGESIFLMREGVVEVSKFLIMKGPGRTFEDKDKTVTRLEAGKDTFFGEIGLLAKKVRTASVRAATDCKMYEIYGEDFDKLAQEDTALGYKVLKAISKILCDRLSVASQDIIKLTTALSIAIR